MGKQENVLRESVVNVWRVSFRECVEGECGERVEGESGDVTIEREVVDGVNERLAEQSLSDPDSDSGDLDPTSLHR